MATSGSLEIHTLGGLAIGCQGTKVTGFASRKVEALLVYLACTGRPKAREVLAELLWEERSQSQGLSNLRVALSSLRKQLAPYLLVTRDTVGLDPQARVWLDTAELERQLASVRDQRGPFAAGIVAGAKQALALYRGDFLEGFYLRESSGFESWMALERERIRAVYEQLAQWLLEVLLENESWHETIEWGERWISLGQTPEPAYRALMQAYSGLGDAANVSAVYQRCMQSLADDLGVEPSEQTRRVHAQCMKGVPPPHSAPARSADVQRSVETSARVLLQQGSKREGEILDLATLAAISAGQGGLEIGAEEAGLLVRSALHHGLDAGPWLRRAGSPGDAVRALEGTWGSYPRLPVRLRVVQSLRDLPGDEAVAALEHICLADDAPEVRTEAALAAAGRGRLGTVVEALVADLGSGREAGAMAALVAIADECGLPKGTTPHPRLPFLAALAQRRWSARRGSILSQGLWAGVGAAIAWALFGLSTPLYSALASLEDYRAVLQQLQSVWAWMLAGAMIAFVVGGALGSAEGFAVGLADALWKGPSRPRWRLAFGGLAGLLHALYLFVFTQVGAYAPSATPGTYVPVYVLYGLVQGMIASFAMPKLGHAAPARQQLVLSLAVGLAAAAVTVPYVYLVYQDQARISLLSRLLNAFLLVLGMGLSRVSRATGSRAR